MKYLIYIFILCSFLGQSQDRGWRRAIFEQSISKTPTEDKAFPTAEGFAKNTTGGKGGTIYHVTNNSNNSAVVGSVKYGIENVSGPRTIVFDVSGEFVLSTSSSAPDRLNIGLASDGDISILGQTAPDGGVTFRDGNLWIQGESEIILRYLRFRPGRAWEPYAGDPGNDDDVIRLIQATGGVGSASNIMFDHLTISWGEDGLFDIGGGSSWNWNDITIQNCLLYENWSTHYTSLIGGYNTDGISWIRNVTAHSSARNPLLGVRNPNPNQHEVVNNVTYYGGDSPRAMSQQTQVDLIGNVDIENPLYPATYHEAMRYDTGYGLSPVTSEIYFFNNLNDHYVSGSSIVSSGTSPYVVGSRIADSGYTPLPASLIEDILLPTVGASLGRDAADTRVINDIQNGTGGVITDEDEVGGYPTIASNTRAGGYYESGTDIAADFYALHGLTGGNTGVKAYFDFPAYTLRGVSYPAYRYNNIYSEQNIDVFHNYLARDYDEMPFD